MSQKPGFKLFDTSKRVRTNQGPSASSTTGGRSTAQRVFDGAILVTQFTSVVAGANDLLGPLKVASDILGFVLKSVQVTIVPYVPGVYCSQLCRMPEMPVRDGRHSSGDSIFTSLSFKVRRETLTRIANSIRKT
jgi:hypothetical protein